MPMYEPIKKIFRDNEPELILLTYSENHTGTFQLVDCDGYRLGKIICEEIHLLCVTTQWESFNEIEVLPITELKETGAFSWLTETAPKDYLLVRLTPSLNDDDEVSALPIIGDARRGYILCKSISFEREQSPGR
jgi:hypothetical protein